MTNKYEPMSLGLSEGGRSQLDSSSDSEDAALFVLPPAKGAAATKNTNGSSWRESEGGRTVFPRKRVSLLLPSDSFDPPYVYVAKYVG